MAFFIFFSIKRFLPLFNLKFFFVFLLAFFASPSLAVKVHFPKDELASESVLPLLDKSQMVLNRNVSLKWSLEIGAGAGFGMDEPYYFPYYPSGFLALHWTEVQAISLTGIYFIFDLFQTGKNLSPTERKLSQAGKKLYEGVGKNPDEIKKIDFSKIPSPQYSFFVNYQYTPFYGKISLSKSWVMNLSIYGFAGPGLVISNNNDQWPAGNVGIGQKLYFNKWFGLRGDLSFYGYYGQVVSKEGMPDDQGTVINILANIGVVFLI